MSAAPEIPILKERQSCLSRALVILANDLRCIHATVVSFGRDPI